MTGDDGRTNAAWNPHDGLTHTLDVELTVNRVTALAKRTAVLQVFDPNEGPYWEVFAGTTSRGLYAYKFHKEGGKDTYILDEDFPLETKFSLRSVIKDSTLDFFYNDELVATINDIDQDTFYYKTGDYCQSGRHDEDPEDYCEVLLHKMHLSHWRGRRETWSSAAA